MCVCVCVCVCVCCELSEVGGGEGVRASVRYIHDGGIAEAE